MAITPKVAAIVAEIENTPVEEVIADDVLVEAPPVKNFKVGDKVRLVPGATYASGAAISETMAQSMLYVRQVLKDDKYAVSIRSTGKSDGIVLGKHMIDYTETPLAEPIYLCLVLDESVEIKSRPEKSAKTLKTIHRHGLYNVMEEKKGWCHLKIGGWIPLESVRKLNH